MSGLNELLLLASVLGCDGDKGTGGALLSQVRAIFCSFGTSAGVCVCGLYSVKIGGARRCSREERAVGRRGQKIPLAGTTKCTQTVERDRETRGPRTCFNQLNN